MAEYKPPKMNAERIVDMLRVARATEFRHFCDQLLTGPVADSAKLADDLLIGRQQFDADTEAAIRFIRKHAKEE